MAFRNVDDRELRLNGRVIKAPSDVLTALAATKLVDLVACDQIDKSAPDLGRDLHRILSFDKLLDPLSRLEE
jgi:hypothetical protein